MQPTLIHEADDFLVINKPAGIAVHPARTTAVVQSGGRGAGVKGETVVDWLIKKYPEVRRVGDDPKERPGIVHRLDKDTSGVMIVARNQQAFEDLKRLFKERRVEKTYLALVAGTPKKKSGVIDAPIGRSLRNPLKRATGRASRQPRPAVTRYRVLERFPAHTSDRRHVLADGGCALLAVKPETGRTHQIRVHLASIGHPVAGDGTYGGTRAALPGLARQFLHAWRLSFGYPEGRRWRFESALPEDLDAVLRRLRADKKRARKA